MSGAAAVELNPNVDVGAEDSTSSQSGESVSFDDLDAPDYDSEKGARKSAKPAKEKKDGVKNDDNRDAPKGEKDKKDSGKKPAEKADAKDEKAKEGDGAEKPEAPKEKKAKPKIHKFQHGETAGDLSGDAVFTIPVNGVQESVPLQDLVNEYNGKKFYEGQHKTFTGEKDKFEKERKDLTDTINDFSERAQKNPEDAWDLLAEMSGGDPTAFKKNMILKNLEAMRPLLGMNQQQLDAWMREQEIGWREKSVAKKEKRAAAQIASLNTTGQRAEIQQKHGVSDEDYQRHYDGVKKYLGGQEPSPDQIVYASKLVTVQDAINSSVPELANHPDRGKIVAELAQEMMANPKTSRASVEATLKQVFGNPATEESALRRAARNAKRNASPDADEPRSTPAPSKRGFESFDDLED